jgi:hypothetical protein
VLPPCITYFRALLIFLSSTSIPLTYVTPRRILELTIKAVEDELSKLPSLVTDERLVAAGAHQSHWRMSRASAVDSADDDLEDEVLCDDTNWNVCSY